MTAWISRLLSALQRASCAMPDEGIVEGDSVFVMRQLPAASFDAAFVDPPYGLAQRSGLGWEFSSHVTLEEDWDSFDVNDYKDFTYMWLNEVRRLVKPNGNIVIFGSYHGIYLVGAVAQEMGLRIINSIVWEKTNPQPNITARMLCEGTEHMIWLCNGDTDGPNKAKNWTFNYDDMKAENGGKQMKNVWQFSVTPRSERALGQHPTQKPLSVMRRLVRALTKPGDRILDPFAGTGTTLVAAWELGRGALGIEREAKYVQIARRRAALVEEPLTPAQRHEGHGAGTEADVDADCGCRGTEDELECASVGCGFCRAEQNDKAREAEFEKNFPSITAAARAVRGRDMMPDPTADVFEIKRGRRLWAAGKPLPEGVPVAVRAEYNRLTRVAGLALADPPLPDEAVVVDGAGVEVDRRTDEPRGEMFTPVDEPTIPRNRDSLVAMAALIQAHDPAAAAELVRTSDAPDKTLPVIDAELEAVSAERPTATPLEPQHAVVRENE